ncbi:hypothetical protein ACIBAH_00185 [Streptomyces sp. NPDC051445]|uniref:hypothetical protein n=1 Tax=Streptomyces sp. NPDC051445 TaxID=3365653 RepID=UPI0037928E61
MIRGWGGGRSWWAAGPRSSPGETADARAATGEGRPALGQGQTVAADPDLGHVFVDRMQDEVFTWLDSVL